MSILISKLPSGAILLQRDSDEIIIDLAAIPYVLPSVLLTLVEAHKALGQARRAAHEDGLTVGYARGVAETEAKYRRAAEQLDEVTLVAVRAPLAA